MPMEIIIAKDYSGLSRTAALLLAAQVIRHPSSVLGLATGSTPEGTYDCLIDMYREGLVDFRRVTTFNLDEYRGVTPQNPCSYRWFMEENLFKHIGIPLEQTHIPNGMTEDIEGECLEYERKICQAGGIDLQLLGLGGNGHIGFNEPANHFSARTQLVDLDAATIKANSRFFSSETEVPRQAISMGIKSIMDARCILLLASGAGKAQAVKGMVKGSITPAHPASVLQLHPQVTIIIDSAAASLL